MISRSSLALSAAAAAELGRATGITDLDLKFLSELKGLEYLSLSSRRKDKCPFFTTPSSVIRLVEGQRAGYVEMEGTPDVALEIVSTSSVKKGQVTLRELC